MAKDTHPMIGKRIKEVRKITKQEAEDNGWGFRAFDAPNVIVLEDGSLVIPSADPEGNNYGCLFGQLRFSATEVVSIRV